MYTPLGSEIASALVRDRQNQAKSAVRARRLITVRRWQRKAERANRVVKVLGRRDDDRGLRHATSLRGGAGRPARMNVPSAIELTATS